MESVVGKGSEWRAERFREGVKALFDVWGALDVMRDNLTGGSNTEDLIEDMFEGVLEQFNFDTGKMSVTHSDLEDMLYDFTSRELCTEVEDGSVEQVADYAVRLFRALLLDDVTLHAKLLAAAEKRNRARARETPQARKKKTAAVNVAKKEQQPNEEAAEGNEDEQEDGDSSEGEGSEEDNENDNNRRDADDADDGDAKNKEGDEDGEWTVVSRGKSNQNVKK